MVINHLLTGMILQEDSIRDPFTHDELRVHFRTIRTYMLLLTRWSDKNLADLTLKQRHACCATDLRAPTHEVRGGKSAVNGLHLGKQHVERKAGGHAEKARRISGEIWFLFFFGYFNKLCGCLQGPPDVVELMAKAHVWTWIAQWFLRTSCFHQRCPAVGRRRANRRNKYFLTTKAEFEMPMDITLGFGAEDLGWPNEVK